MSESPSLSGKTANVTGASSGIGRAIAERLAAAGACVYLVGRSQGPMSELATRIGTTIAESGIIQPYFPLHVHVTSTQQVVRIVRSLRAPLAFNG